MVLKAEEKRELLGILRLLGVRRRRVLLEVLIEGVFIASLGAIGGLILAVLTQDLVNIYFQHKYNTPLIFMNISPKVIIQCLAIALPLGVLTSLFASWHAIRRKVLELMRG